MGLSEETKRAPSAPVWNQSFPSPRHCLSAAPSLSGATLLCHFSRAFPYPQPGDACGRRSAPARQPVSHTGWRWYVHHQQLGDITHRTVWHDWRWYVHHQQLRDITHRTVWYDWLLFPLPSLTHSLLLPQHGSYLPCCCAATFTHIQHVMHTRSTALTHNWPEIISHSVLVQLECRVLSSISMPSNQHLNHFGYLQPEIIH